MGMSPHGIVENGVVVGRGLRLDQIDPGGPASLAGLRDGDVLTMFNGSPVARPSAVARLHAPDVVGRQVPVAIRRDGAEYQLVVVPAPR